MNPLSRIWLYTRPYWFRSLLALVFLTVLVVLDLAIPRLVQQIIDEGVMKNDLPTVVHVSLVMIGITVVSTCIAVGNNIVSVQVGESVARDIREALFLRIQDFSFANLDAQRTGQLLVRLSSDTRAVQMLVQVTLRIGTRAPMLMVGSVILMFRTSQELALYLVPLLAVTAGLIVWFVVKTEPLFASVQQRLDRLNTVLQENIGGARLVKAFVRAAYEGERFEAANRDFTDQSIRVMQLMASMQPVLTLCVNLGLVVVLWVGGVRAIHDQLTVGQIVAFTNYLLTTMTPLIMMTRLSNVWATGLVSTNRIGEVLDTEPTVQDAPDARDLPADAPGRVELQGVTFHYDSKRSEPVLTDVDLVAEPGQTVAILGATGAGKSSLVNLVPRFYDVTGGRVLVDGQDVRELRQDSLLAHIAMVPQESILFAGSVRDNIRYGQPDAPEDAVIAAARAAQAHDFICDLPDGYDTDVAERGVNLSGGQKQRLAIARALLMQPRILILDDATSAVDVETETRIQDALATWPGRPTSLVVAQRISTVLHADSIVVLDEGRLVARGTHRELMASSPVYREIYDSQLGGGPRGLEPEATP